MTVCCANDHSLRETNEFKILAANGVSLPWLEEPTHRLNYNINKNMFERFTRFDKSDKLMSDYANRI